MCAGGHLLDLVNKRASAGSPLSEQEILGYFLQETAAAQAVLDAKMQLAQAEAASHQPVPPVPYPAAVAGPQQLQQSPQAASVQQPRAEQGQQWPTSDGLAFEAWC